MRSSLSVVRVATRFVTRAPGLSAIAVLAFALGIGLTAATFSILDGVILRGLPLESPEELVHVEQSNLPAGVNSIAVPIHDFVEWRAEQRVFTDMAAFYEGTVNLAAPGLRAERYDGAYTTASLFELARVRAVLGRTLRADDERPGAPAVAVIGHTIWENRFGRDPNVVGSTMRVNGEQTMIVGVMPRGFEFPVRQDIWVPLRMNPLDIPRGEGIGLEVFGRLRPGVSLDQAYAGIATIARQLESRYPTTNAGVMPLLKPYTEEFITASERALFFVMFGAVLGVLLIACANVANLLLARAVVRGRDVAIRSALGASRARILAQFLGEALVLSVLGGAFGLGIAYAGVAFFNAAVKAASQVPFWVEVRLDLTVVAFTVALTTLASVVAGALPALQASGVSLGDVLKDEGRGSSSFRLARFSRALVVVEVALSCALLVGAGMLVKSILMLKRTDFGVRTESIFTARAELPESEYGDATARARFHTELARRLESEPGVQGVALATSLPLAPAPGRVYSVEGEQYATDRDRPLAGRVAVSPTFFATFEITVLRGRAFGEGDRAGALPVALVNESFARRHFPAGDPIGRRFRVGDGESTEPWLTIVGVAEDAYVNGVREQEDHSGFYVPVAQAPPTAITVVVRTGGEPLALAGRVREIVGAMNPDVPTYDVRTMEQVVALSTWFYGMFGTLFGAFGVAALFLAAIGLYGVMSFSVSRRTQEMGVRVALGARPADVLGLVLRQGLWQLGIGLTLGLGLAGLLAQGLQLLLFRVGAADVTVFGGVVLVLMVSGVTACLIPARRATRVDPMTTMRSS